MGDEISEEQLLEFCQRLGLARDGYLDEKDLAVVCKCIGVEVPSEKIKELFEELDGDKDGKICLAELSQMFRGMQSRMPSSPERNSKSDCQTITGNSSKSTSNFPTSLVEKGCFMVLDPDNTGFTNVGYILDFWSQLGINQDNGLQILKDMGFQACSRSNSINLQALTKSIEDELDQCNELGLPITIQIALLTYRTEIQQLRATCEGVETERDKLKQDIFEASQRSTLLAQEIDEQNARLEKTNQNLIHKLESKYNDQIHEMQRRFALEKESFQQIIQSLETKQKSLRDEEARIRVQIASLTLENSNLEREVQILNQDVRNVNRLKSQLEREMSRYNELESRVIEMEKINSKAMEATERELQKARSDAQTLRDQNDELSVRLEGMTGTLHSLKAKEEKRYFVKRRKGSFTRHEHNGIHSGDVCDEMNGIPLEKVVKYNQPNNVDSNVSLFEEDGEFSMHPSFSFSSSSGPGSGNYIPAHAISLSACMGESSTDHGNGFGRNKVSTWNSQPYDSDSQHKSLEVEMDSVKQKIVTILSEKEQLIKENDKLRSRYNEASASLSDYGTSSRSRAEGLTASTQTSLTNFCNDCKSATESLQAKQTQINELESQLENSKATLLKEQETNKTQNAELEKSLELLQGEYEKCEEYWHGKLQEARDEYELDRDSSDERFNELASKIQEYEDVFLKQTELDDMRTNEKLPPIAECASLERQVNDLEDECEGLRRELVCVKLAHESTLENYQKQCESKILEDSANHEQQVSILTMKCHEYENRLSSLAEEEKSNFEDAGMMNMLKNRIHQLESQVRAQDVKNIELSNELANFRRDGDSILKSPMLEVSTQTGYPQPELQSSQESTQSKSLLEMLSQPKPESRSASLPYYFSTEEMSYPLSGGMVSPPIYPQQDVWGFQSIQTPAPSKKAWCHVELGWLQALRSKLKQRDEQCFILQQTLHQKEIQTATIVSSMKALHAAEKCHWESLLSTSQELNRQNSIKHREQAEKLAQADGVLKDLWVENAKLKQELYSKDLQAEKLVQALNATEQRVNQVENLLKFQMNPLTFASVVNNNNSSQSSLHSLPNQFNKN